VSKEECFVGCLFVEFEKKLQVEFVGGESVDVGFVGGSAGRFELVNEHCGLFGGSEVSL
jgi:hypothetical protein